jgi:hypothetical protein
MSADAAKCRARKEARTLPSVADPKKAQEKELTKHTHLKKPPIRQVQMDLFAEPPLRSDAEAIAHQQHPDEEFRVY